MKIIIFFYRLSAFLFFFGSLAPLFSENTNDNISLVSRRMEFLVQQTRPDFSDIDYEELTNRFLFYLINPININKIEEEDLKYLGLTRLQIAGIKKHILEYGDFLELEELKLVDGFSNQEIITLLPFLTLRKRTFSKNFNFKKAIFKGQHFLSLGYKNILQTTKGDTQKNNAYLGPSFGLQFKYRYTFNQNLKIGITLEKDEGEPLFSNNTTIDYFTGYVFYKPSDDRGLKSFLVGNYNLQWGQGVLLWTGLSFNKTADAVHVSKSTQLFTPYNSINEFGYLQGVAAEFGYKKFRYSFAYSNRQLDANVFDNDSINIFSSLNQTGLHRTTLELSRKNQLNEQLFFADGGIDFGSFSVSSSVAYFLYDKPFAPDVKIYNLYRPHQGKILKYGLTADYVYKNLHFFGELVQSKPYSGISGLLGTQIIFSKHLTYAAVFRNYSKKYRYERSRAFSENTYPNNEIGFYQGASLSLFDSKIILSGYVDVFNFPAPKYTALLPSLGEEYTFQILYQPNKKFTTSIRIKFNDYQRNAINSEQDILRSLENQRFLVYYLYYDYRASAFIRLRGRLGISSFRRKDVVNQQGFVLLQDVIYRSFKSPLSFILRYALFETESYNARLYFFENDILNSFSFPLFSGKGIRINLIADYKVNKLVKFSTQLTHQFFLDKKSIGSGIEEISGPSRTLLKFKLQIKI